MKIKINGIIWSTSLFLCVSCATSSSTVQPKNENTDKQQNVEYVKLIGTEPFWNVSISEAEIRYSNMEGEKIVFPYQEPVRVMDANIKTYKTSHANYTLEATVTHQECSDGMSDQVYDYSAAVVIKKNGKQFQDLKGCAYYSLDPRLEGKWRLVQIHTKKIPESPSYAHPYIEFDTENKRASGNTSCNGFSSNVFAEGKTIRFTQTALTRMFCVNENIEAEFSKTLSEITSYEITATGLRLFSGKELKMVLEK